MCRQEESVSYHCQQELPGRLRRRLNSTPGGTAVEKKFNQGESVSRLVSPSRSQKIQQVLTELQTALSRVLDELQRFLKKGKSSKFDGQDDGHIISSPAVKV